MQLMRSKVEHRYDGRVLSVGEEFEADDRLVRTLTALGRAEVVRVSTRPTGNGKKRR